jgi:hypothetical protein
MKREQFMKSYQGQRYRATPYLESFFHEISQAQIFPVAEAPLNPQKTNKGNRPTSVNPRLSLLLLGLLHLQ